MTDGRDELARRTGIPATSLSSVNTGKRPLTMAAATRIAEATGATLEELGAPAEGDPRFDPRIARLQELVDQVNVGRSLVIEALASIDDRLSRIEERLGLEVREGTTARAAE